MTDTGLVLYTLHKDGNLAWTKMWGKMEKGSRLGGYKHPEIMWSSRVVSRLYYISANAAGNDGNRFR